MNTHQNETVTSDTDQEFEDNQQNNRSSIHEPCSPSELVDRHLESDRVTVWSKGDGCTETYR